jgi:hemoglobin/transferrin/lactoferrin receptor protein
MCNVPIYDRFSPNYIKTACYPRNMGTLLRVLLVLAAPAVTAFAQPARTAPRVEGIVEDTSGGAIRGAAVTATCGRETQTTTTDAAGVFEVRNLPATKCVVTALSPQFAGTSVDVDMSVRTTAYVRLILTVAALAAEVTVTPARGEREPTFNIPEAVTIATREEIESRPHQILPQVLREEPGVLVQQTTTAQGSPFIRGFSAQRLLYLVDGVRFNTAMFRAGATQYLGWVPAPLVQRLEVVRGPGSVQYGSDALGGTINVLTPTPVPRDGGRRVKGHAEILAGSADLSGATDAGIHLRGPRLAALIGGGARAIGDLRPGRGRDSRSALSRFLGLPSSTLYDRLPGTSFSQAGSRVLATARLGERDSVTGLYLHEQQHRVRRYDRMLGGDGLFRSLFDPQQLDFGYVRYTRRDVARLSELRAGVSFNRQQDGRLEQARPIARVERESGRVTARGYQAQANAIAGTHALTFGGEIYDESIRASRSFEAPGSGRLEAQRPEIPDRTGYVSTGLFLQDFAELVPGRLSARGGVRYGRFAFRTREDAALVVAAEEVTTDALTFNGGLVIGLTRAMNATVSVSRGFRAPNAFDLGAIGLSGGGFELSPGRAASLGGRIGSSDGADAIDTGRAVAGLGPESLYAFEAGLKVRGARASGGIVFFDLELVDAIQRRTVIFGSPLVGTAVAGYEIVRQDGAGRAFVAADPRPLVTRVNIERARVAGFEADAQFRVAPAWLATAHFSVVRGRELGTDRGDAASATQADVPLRRMPPPLGGARVKWEPLTHPVWAEVVATFAMAQTRVSSGDLSDPRIGAQRTRASIASFFEGTAVDLGLVSGGFLQPTGERLDQLQARLLGDAAARPLFTRTAGFVTLGLRAGWRISDVVDVAVLGENLADRHYRLHGSGVDAPGFNVQARVRYRF